MKITFVAEDCIAGIACGLLLLGFAGRFFSLKLPNFAYVVAFAIFIIFIVLDIAHEFHEMAMHFAFTSLSIIHNIIDVAISLVMISYFSGLNLPYITEIFVPMLNEITMGYLGIFLAVSNAAWIVVAPFVY